MTGKNSKSQLARLSSKYLEMQKSGPLISNRAALSVLDERFLELFDRMEENYSPKRITKIIDAWEKMKENLPGLKMWVKDRPEAQRAYNTLDSEVDKAYHDYEGWRQIGELIDLRQKVSSSEMRMLKDMKALISAEDAYELVAQLLAAVVKVLGDEPNGPKLIKAIHYEFAQILGEPIVDRPGAGGGEIIEVNAIEVD